MEVKTVGIVGYGAFGALVHTLLKRFAPTLEVRVYSHGKDADGKTFFSLSEVAQSDAVILAVPIRAFQAALTKVLPLLGKETVLVDVATVKVHTTELLKRLAKGRRYIATHPMWGPESYEKRGGDIAGFRIVVADHTLTGSEYAAASAFLKQLGFTVIEMTPEAHDKRLAETLFLTQFIGQIVSRGGFRRTDIDTVSFGFLMDAVESVQHDGLLFRDVFRFNPYCADVLKRFKEAKSAVRRLLKTKAPVASTALLRIGISGAKGSFSEEAARGYAAGAGVKKFSLDYLVSVENVLAALDTGAIDLGVFPIANSTGGVGTEAETAVSRHHFDVKKLFGIDIRQNLLARKGVSRDEIKTIVSHDQALKQCKGYLKKNWPNVKVEEYEDTAKAAEDLASGKLPPTTAVIASRIAAEIYDLELLEESIQDLTSNFTTFIAVAPRS